MRKLTVMALAAVLFAGPGTAAAQNPSSSRDSCEAIHAGGSPAGRDALYVRATCVAARAGFAGPKERQLSREELLSIIVLMSLQRPPAKRAS